jgi:DNA-binding NarL/FixJ family response regulator
MAIIVLLADSVVGVRQIERTLLQKEPDIEVVGEATDEPEAMMLIKSLEPQIVLTLTFDRPGRFLPSKSNPNTPGQRFWA